MKILLNSVLKKLIGYRVDAAAGRGDEANREEAILSVLAEFARCGDAERYVRRDGRIGWRATSRFLEKLREGEAEAEQHDELV